MIEKIEMIVGLIFSAALLIIPFIGNRCPDCKGKLIDTDYDVNINKVVWTCKRCGKKWVIL